MTQARAGRLFVAFLVFSASSSAQSQSDEPNAGSAAPAERVQSPQPLPYQAQPPTQPAAPSAPAQPVPAQPAPAPQPAYGNNYGAPQPYAAPAADGSARAANNQNYQNSYPNQSREPYTGGNEESKSNFEMPAWSVRLDPFNWLLAGRLGLELESQVWKFISVELVPVFIVNDQPPYLNLGFAGVPNTLYQKSAGIGALAGTSVGVGFWLNGKPMEGYVLRAELTDYAITYDAHDNLGPIDQFKYVERYFQVLLGSHSKWGPFTLAGTFGLGTALNKVQRCFIDNAAVTSGCPNSKNAELMVTRLGDTVNLNQWSYPIDIVVRISLGVAF